MTATPGELQAAAPTPPPPARTGSRRGRAVRYLLAALFTLVGAVGTLPDLFFGLDQRSPFAQLISFRPLILVGVLALFVVLGIATFFERRVWPFAAGVLAVLVVGATLVLPRAIADPVPTTGRPLTVLAFNVFEGRADVTAIAELIRTEHPDLVSLPEGGTRFKAKLGPLIEPMGYRLTSSTEAGVRDVDSVDVAVAGSLGDVTVRIGDETADPYLEVTGGTLGSLRFVAFHSKAPVPGLVPQWRADLAQLPMWCAGPTPAIVAGDFNATLDHSALRSGMAGCGDAADQRGEGLAPTWGKGGPTLQSIGPQIDHVIATTGIEAETFSVHDLPGSDHRAILTRLRLPG